MTKLPTAPRPSAPPRGHPIDPKGGRSPAGTGHSAEPEPIFVVSAETASVPNAFEVLDRLKSRLPICPFDALAPAHSLEPADPCPVCGDYGDERSKNLCCGADTRILASAATLIRHYLSALQSIATGYVVGAEVDHELTITTMRMIATEALAASAIESDTQGAA